MDKYGGNALETFHLMELRMSQKVDVSYDLYEGKGNYRTYVFYHGTGNGLRLLKNLEVFHSDNCQNAETIAFRFRIITIEKKDWERSAYKHDTENNNARNFNYSL